MGICDRIHRALAVDLPVSVLLERGTVKALAALVDELRSGTANTTWSSVVLIQPNGSRPPIFCVSGSAAIPSRFAISPICLSRTAVLRLAVPGSGRVGTPLGLR